VILEISLDAGFQAPCAVAVDDPNRAGRSLGKVLFQNGLSISNGFPPQIEGVLAGAQFRGAWLQGRSGALGVRASCVIMGSLPRAL
jgi:hypothetical protein